MRVSDLQGIDVSRLRLFRDGLKGFLVKTKTTGPDKKVAEVPFFIGRCVGLSGRTGFSVFGGLSSRSPRWLATICVLSGADLGYLSGSLESSFGGRGLRVS